MEYKFTPRHENYAPYASGGVFHSAPGHPAFPVRLAVEIFRRCLHWRAAGSAAGPFVLYDPCCGGAYHLATLPWFNWEQIAAIYASDLDAVALGVAARNLALLSPEGMARRVDELAAMHGAWGKPSHAAALADAQALQARQAELSAGHAIGTHLFRADATDGAAVAAVAAGVAGARIDVVIADVPYGQISTWQGGTSALAQGADPVWRLLDALLPVLAGGAVVALAAGKGDKLKHERYRRLERFTVGKRQIALLQRA